MGMFLGLGVILVVLYILNKRGPSKSSINPSSQNPSCADECSCNSLHYHWIDRHRQDLQSYPNCFIALHPNRGIIFFDPDIQNFSEKMRSHQTLNLMVLHTSMIDAHKCQRTLKEEGI